MSFSTPGATISRTTESTKALLAIDLHVLPLLGGI